MLWVQGSKSVYHSRFDEAVRPNETEVKWRQWNLDSQVVNEEQAGAAVRLLRPLYM
jgi:hypothetical protein